MSAAGSPTQNDLFQYLLRLADDRLVLGHRLSEWCGHAPILEEDIALANIALDLIGQADFFLRLAGKVENQGRSADDLAYFRMAIEFRNLLLVEQPNGDFAFTIARQFLFDAFDIPLLDELTRSKHAELAGLASRSIKESRYHLRHSREWMLRLGDGTDESHRRCQAAVDALWRFTGEIFQPDDVDRRLLETGVGANLTSIREAWAAQVRETLQEATLSHPDSEQPMTAGSRQGIHSEHLGHLLTEMQILPRSYPEAKW